MPLPTPNETQGFRLLHALFTQGKRIFNMQDVKKVAETQNIPPRQLRKVLSNLTKHGRLLRLRRGLYVGLGLVADNTRVHPFVISAYLIQPSAISHWSALQHHGLTEQIPYVVTASTTRKILTPSMRKTQPRNLNAKHAWEIEGVRYEYINIQEKHFFGTEKIWLGEHFQISITDKERTLLDLFIYSKMFGGMGEALGILENSLATIDIKKLVEYTIQYDKKSLTKRLGWALEYFGVPARKYAPLLKVPINHYCRLDPSLPAIGPYDKRWMIQNNLTREQKNETIADENSK